MGPIRCLFHSPHQIQRMWVCGTTRKGPRCMYTQRKSQPGLHSQEFPEAWSGAHPCLFTPRVLGLKHPRLLQTSHPFLCLSFSPPTHNSNLRSVMSQRVVHGCYSSRNMVSCYMSTCLRQTLTTRLQGHLCPLTQAWHLHCMSKPGVGTMSWTGPSSTEFLAATLFRCCNKTAAAGNVAVLQ